jgi:uncharacterized protein YdeI (YjbR/CyaY-like superfamily)
MDPRPGDPVLPFADAAAFERWLAAEHARASVVWIKHAKKASGVATVTWTEAVDVALCYGWIDGQAKSLDDAWYLQRYTPRRAASPWSKINRQRVARLIGDGRMRPAGLAEVERAKADGRWDAAYDSPATATVPADLAAALARNKRAATAFAALDATNRYAVLHRLMTATLPATRARRLATFVEMLAAGKTLHPRRHPKPKPKPMPKSKSKSKAKSKPKPKPKPKAKSKPKSKSKSKPKSKPKSKTKPKPTSG